MIQKSYCGFGDEIKIGGYYNCSNCGYSISLLKEGEEFPECPKCQKSKCLDVKRCWKLSTQYGD